MSELEHRDPGQDGQWISYTTSTPEIWTTTSQWIPPSYTTETGFVTSYTTTTECDCDEWTTPTTSSWCETPIIVPPTTTAPFPVVTTPSEVIVVDHHSHGLSPGAVGGIVIGAFFGALLLFLLCICCLTPYGRRRRYYGSDSSSTSSHRRRKPPVVIIDPYPRRPEANLTFVGGGNYPGTRVMVTKTQKTFIRPPPVKQIRTIRETRRTEKIRIIEDDD
jgi:hypothetical protein